MDRRFWAGIIAGAAVLALVVIGIVAYTNNGGSLASANNCGSSCAESGAGGCGGESYGSGCGEQIAPTTNATTDLKSLEKEAVDYYARTYGDSNVTAKTFNAGCCTGIAIIKDGKVIDSFKYKDGQFFK
ncbi:MAG: hypothetical protein GX421_07330 [Caldisericales bacterium]|nr:hypothetical protein [Caldisericales bacterium]